MLRIHPNHHISIMFIKSSVSHMILSSSIEYVSCIVVLLLAGTELVIQPKWNLNWKRACNINDRRHIRWMRWQNESEDFRFVPLRCVNWYASSRFPALFWFTSSSSVFLSPCCYWIVVVRESREELQSRDCVEPRSCRMRLCRTKQLQEEGRLKNEEEKCRNEDREIAKWEFAEWRILQSEEWRCVFIDFLPNLLEM